MSYPIFSSVNLSNSSTINYRHTKDHLGHLPEHQSGHSIAVETRRRYERPVQQSMPRVRELQGQNQRPVNGSTHDEPEVGDEYISPDEYIPSYSLSPIPVEHMTIHVPHPGRHALQVEHSPPNMSEPRGRHSFSAKHNQLLKPDSLRRHRLPEKRSKSQVIEQRNRQSLPVEYRAPHVTKLQTLHKRPLENGTLHASSSRHRHETKIGIGQVLRVPAHVSTSSRRLSDR